MSAHVGDYGHHALHHHQLLDCRLVPGCRLAWVLVEEVVAAVDLLLVEAAAEYEVLLC